MDLKKLHETLLAGKASLEDDQIKILQNDFSLFIKELVNIKLLDDDINFEIASSIFSSVYPSQLCSNLMGEISSDDFFEFGEYLLLVYEKNETPEITNIIYNYLDIFRQPIFLNKIYTERRWDELISNLIQKSKYTVNELLKSRVNLYKSKSLFKILKGNNEKIYTWKESYKTITNYKSAVANQITLINSEDVKISFLLENSITMVFLDLACLTSGIPNIMIPANSVPLHILYILNKTESEILFVTDEKQLSKIKSIKNDLKFLKRVILLEGKSAEDWVFSFEEFLEFDEKTSEKVLELYNKKTTIDSTATIMFTSGTTGEPKGIEFSQLNIVYKRFCRAMALPNIGDEDRYLSFLPLFHTFGRYLEMMGAIFWGAEYVFMENPSAETMIANMQKVKPSIFISIPKKWIQLYERITTEVDIEFENKEAIQNKVNEITGGNLKWGLSAAGFLPSEIFRFFQNNNIELMSGFGMTEATGGITMTPPNRYTENSLGCELPGIKIKLADDGELLIKGNYVMKGYFGESYEETFDQDGWFATGDIMQKDSNDFIEIIDRKKEIYKNVKGETIAPQKIENLFRDFELVKQVFLVGDHRQFNTVLIYPNYYSENLKLDDFDDTERTHYFSSVVAAVNNFLAPFERIVDFRIIDSPFSLENDELTPKGTYKRRVIEKNYDSIIEEMYEKDHVDLFIDGLEIRIPNWFLREKGSLSGDIKASENKIIIPKLNVSLTIKLENKEEKIVRIGSYSYKILTRYIDFQFFLTNPIYWVGNIELFNFAGESIFQWYRQRQTDKNIKFIDKHGEFEVADSKIVKIHELKNAKEVSLFGLNLAVSILQSNDENDSKIAAEYLTLFFQDKSLPIFKFAKYFISKTNLPNFISTKRILLVIGINYLTKTEIQILLENFIKSNKDIIDNYVIEEFVKNSRGIESLELLEEEIHNEYEREVINKDLQKSALPGLLNILCKLGIKHPTRYKKIRQIFVRYQLTSEWVELAELSKDLRKIVREEFRSWLGDNNTIAVDIETGDEYGWEDVITFEPTIEEKNQEILKNSITKTAILREAIFLFSKGIIIQLNNILPSGIWISQLAILDDKSVYRVTVQTRFQGAFEVVFNLNNSLTENDILEEINWAILSSSKISGQILAEDFGGYWDDFNIWSEEYISHESIDKFFKKSVRKKIDGQETKLFHIWPFFVWNATTAYYNFWKLTGYKMMLSNPLTNNIVIPTHDYQTGTRLLSITGREKSSSLIDFLINFDQKYITETEEIYPFLKNNKIWNYVFSGIINAEGTKKGIKILQVLREEISKNSGNEKWVKIKECLTKFLDSIEKSGFMPKRLYFSIKRFHRWRELNSDATISAQAEMLYELYVTYRLSEIEKEFPATRTRFFFETAFAKSSEKLRSILYEIIELQRQGKITHDEALTKFSNIKNELGISKDEEYFISRLSYPHLKPADEAELIFSKTEGATTINLVVQYQDYDGAQFSIRKPISPKEISRLHQLFIEENLMVTFKTDHQFLVAISDRGFIIGGLFYYHTSEDTIHMDKVVVSEKYRKQGISDKLMNELFNRLVGENISFVTTGFFRPEYFYKFGFKIEKKYTGLVKDLSIIEKIKNIAKKNIYL